MMSILSLSHLVQCYPYFCKRNSLSVDTISLITYSFFPDIQVHQEAFEVSGAKESPSKTEAKDHFRPSPGLRRRNAYEYY